MGNPSPGSKLKKTTTPPSKTIHRRAPSVTSLSLENIGKDVASPEKSNGAGKFVASTSSPAGGSGEKFMSPAAKDAKLRRRVRSSLGGTEDFVFGDDFNAGTPPTEEKRAPPAEEKKHPFLLARGGIGRNGIRSSSTSQPLQSLTVKQCMTTPPGKEITALGRAASASTYSPRKVDPNSKKAEKEISLIKSATAKSVKVQADSVAIGRPKPNQSVQLRARRKLVAGDNSCLPTSSDVLNTSKPDLERDLISEPLASEDSTRPEIMDLGEVPAYIEGEPEKELTSKEVNLAEADQLHLPTLDTEEGIAAVSTKLQPILDNAQEVCSPPRLKSETSFGQDKDIPTDFPSEEVSNPWVKLEATDTELTLASLTSLMPPSFQGILVEQEGHWARKDDDFDCYLPSEEVTKLEKFGEGLERPDTDESNSTLQSLESNCSDWTCQKQGWNDTHDEDPGVNTMNYLPTYKLSDSVSSAQEHQVDLHIADTRRSASTCAISLESPSSKPVGPQEEVFITPAVSEELRVSTKNILTGFSSNVICSPEGSQHSITQQEFAEIGTSNTVPTFQQEAAGFPSDTSLERSTTVDVHESHGMSRDLGTAGSLCIKLMPNSVCRSAEDSGSVGDANQDLTAATRQNDFLRPSEDVESHMDLLDLLEEGLHAVRTQTTAFPPDALPEVVAPLNINQETYKNKLYSFHSAPLIDSVDDFHDSPSQQTTSPICTQETDSQAGTSIVTQQAELGLKDAPSTIDAYQESIASTEMTPTMFDISPSLDTSCELCNASPVPYAKQATKATSVNVNAACLSLGKLPTSRVGLDNQNELCTSIDNFTFSGEAANKDLGDSAVIRDESCQDSVTGVMDPNRSVEPLDWPKSETGNLSRVQEVLEEGLTNDPESGKFAEEATHSVDEEKATCLLEETRNGLKSENWTSPKIQEVSEEGLTNIPDNGACAEKARHSLDEGITRSLIQEPLDGPENRALPKLQELAEEWLTNIPKEASACAEEASQTVDEGSTLCLLPKPLGCPNSENGSSRKIQEVSENGLSNIPENGAHADKARHGVDEGRKACLLQELLESGNGTSPNIKEVSDEGVTNTPENGTCAEEAIDGVAEVITPCLLQKPLHCPKSENSISPNSQELSGVTITPENSTCAAEIADSVDEGSKTCQLDESSLIALEMGVGAPLVFAEGICRETGSAVQKDLMLADGGRAKEVEYSTGDGKTPAPVTEDVQSLHVDTQAEAVGVVLHQEQGGDEKVSSTNLLAFEALRDTDTTMLEDLGMAVGPSVAQSPMKPIETTTVLGGSDTVYEREAGESPVSTDCMFGSAAEDTDEGQIEKLDSIESFELELSTEEDVNCEDDESSGSSLLQYDLANSQGPVSLKHHANGTSDKSEKSDTSNKLSEASLDMLEDHRVADAILQFSNELDPAIEDSSAISLQGPVINRVPIIGAVARDTSMVISSIPENGKCGEHHTDSVYHGEAQKPEVPEVNLCKQEAEISGEVRAHEAPLLEMRCAPILQDKSRFHAQESLMEGIVGKEADPFAREVYLGAYPVETPGNEENLNCLKKLPTYPEVDNSNTMVSVATKDNSEGCLQEVILEMLEDKRSGSNTNDPEQWSHEEQYMCAAADSNDSAVSMESIDGSAAFPMTNQEKQDESSVEALEMLEDDRSDIAFNEEDQRWFEEQPMVCAADSNDSAVLMESLDISETFSVTDHEKQEEISADALEMLKDDKFESEVHYQEHRSLEEQPMFIAADSNDSAVLMDNLDKKESLPMTIQEKQEESSAEAAKMLEDDRPKSEVNYQEQRSLEEQLMFVAADSNDSAGLTESLDNSEALPVPNQEKQEGSSAEALEMPDDARSESEVSVQEQRSVEEEQAMFVAADSNDKAGLMKSLDISKAFPVTNQEKHEESSPEALEMLEGSQAETEDIEQEHRSLEEKQTKIVAADSNDSAVLMKSLDNSEAFPMTNHNKQDKSCAESLEMAKDHRLDIEASGQRILEEQPMLIAADSHDLALFKDNLDNSETFPVNDEEIQEDRSAKTLEMLQNDRSEMKIQEREKRFPEEQPVFLAADSNDLAGLTESLDNFTAFPVTNQENQDKSSAEGLEMPQDSRNESEVSGQEQKSVEVEQAMFVAVDRNDSAVLMECLDNSEEFPVTDLEKQDKSSAEGLEMLEDNRSEIEVQDQEKRSLEKQSIFVAADGSDMSVFTESLGNSESFPLTSQVKQDDSSAECLEMLEDDRSEMAVQEQEKGSLEEQPMFVTADSSESAMSADCQDNSEAFPVADQEKQEESSPEALQTLEDTRPESAVIEQEQRSVEEEQAIFATADSNDSAVLRESLHISETFPVTDQEKQEESSPEALEMLENDRSETEVQEQEKGSLEEQPILVAADSNDISVLTVSLGNSEAFPVTNQVKQDVSSAEYLEMLEDDRSEMGVQEQEKGSLEEQPIPDAADSNDISVLTESLGNSEAFPGTNQLKQDDSCAESLEMLGDDSSEMEVQEQEKGSLEEQPILNAADSNNISVLTESLGGLQAFPMTNQVRQDDCSAESLEMLGDDRYEMEVQEREKGSLEEQPIFVAVDSSDISMFTESLGNSEAFPVTNQVKQDDSSAECLEMLEDDRSEMEVQEQEKGSLEEQPMLVRADSNDSAVLTECQDNSEALPVANQEKQEESSAEVLEMLEGTRPESAVIEQEQRSVEEEQVLFVAAERSDSAVLREILDISETFPVTNQEKQEESFAEGLEMLEDNTSEMEIQEQENRCLEEQLMFVAADGNDLDLLAEFQDNSEPSQVTNQEKQEETSAEALEMLEVARSANDPSEQEQRSVEEERAMLVAADSNDSSVLVESLDHSEPFPVTNQEKQEESSAEGLEMVENDRCESEMTEQEQWSLEERQPTFVAAESNDSAVLTKGLDTSAAFATQERPEESTAEFLEPREDDKCESKGKEQEKRSLEEKYMFVAADSNDSAVLMGSLDNSVPCLLTNQEQEGSSADTLEMLEDDRFETEVKKQEKTSPEQPICDDTNEQPTSADTNDSTVLVESIDNSEAFLETNQEKQEESSAELSADMLPCFETSRAPAVQENSVCLAKRLVADDGVGEEVHPIISLGPVAPSAVTPENEVEEFDKTEYSVSSYTTELCEELAKSEGFDGVNGIAEQGQRSASDEASRPYSQLQTTHLLSIQDRASDQAQETVSDENAGGVVNPVSRHSLKCASPIITGGNEQEKRIAEADRSLDGNNSNIDIGSVPETSREIIILNKPSQDEISCHSVQAQKDDLVMELAALDCRKPCEKGDHNDANGSEKAEANNDALPLSGSQQPKEHSFNVSQASPTYSIGDEFPAPHQNGMLRHSSLEVEQTQTADQDDSSTALKALPFPEKPCVMANDQSKSMMSASDMSDPETVAVHEPASTMSTVLEQHPFSNSHQDHLWEEQADTYANGSRGVAAHLEEAAINAIHSSTPGAATSLDDQILPASGQVKDTLPDVVAYSSTVENGSTNEGKMEKSKSRTALRHLLAEDASQASNGSISTVPGDSPLKWLFSRLMGKSTKLGEKEIKQEKKRKASVWNACLGVSDVQ